MLDINGVKISVGREVYVACAGFVKNSFIKRGIVKEICGTGAQSIYVVTPCGIRMYFDPESVVVI